VEYRIPVPKHLCLVPSVSIVSLVVSIFSFPILTIISSMQRQAKKLPNLVNNQICLANQKQRYLMAVEIRETVAQLIFAISMSADALLSDERLISRHTMMRLKELSSLTNTTLAAIRQILPKLRPERINRTPLDRLIADDTGASLTFDTLPSLKSKKLTRIWRNSSCQYE
jgi:signal transduction histidine kinase